MYSYEELMNMDETRLRELASSMGIEKTTSADQQELAYYVIDSESENTAKGSCGQKRGKIKNCQREDTKREKNACETCFQERTSTWPAPSAESVTENAEIANEHCCGYRCSAPKRGVNPK